MKTMQEFTSVMPYSQYINGDYTLYLIVLKLGYI